MIILGIDPGTSRVGFAFLEKEGTDIRLLEYGVISTPPKVPFIDKIMLIYNDLQELLDIYQPIVAGVEKLFFLRNVTNGIDVAQARGVMLYSLITRWIKIYEYTPLQVKQWITGSGTAKKPQIQRAIMQILHLSEIPQPDDAADAVAIAYLTALHIR